MHVDLDTLATALYVKINNETEGVTPAQPVPAEGRRRPADHRHRTNRIAHPAGSLATTTRTSECRAARRPSDICFPYLPKQPGLLTNRLRALLTQLAHCIAVLAADTRPCGTTRSASPTPTPVQCGTLRGPVKRSDLAGCAGSGYCAFPGSELSRDCALHLVTTVHGLPVAFAFTNPKTNEREVLVDLVSLATQHVPPPGRADPDRGQGLPDRSTETWLNEQRYRPSYGPPTAPNRPARDGPCSAVRPRLESVDRTLKGRLDLERHGRRTHRRRRPSPATRPRHGRRDLAQLAHGPDRSCDHWSPTTANPGIRSSSRRSPSCRTLSASTISWPSGNSETGRA